MGFEKDSGMENIISQGHSYENLTKTSVMLDDSLACPYRFKTCNLGDARDLVQWA